MIVLYCKICGDLVALREDKAWRSCICQRSAARYGKAKTKAKLRGPARLIFLQEGFLQLNSGQDFEHIEKQVLAHFIPVNSPDVLK